jgi:hypothetical protein
MCLIWRVLDAKKGIPMPVVTVGAHVTATSQQRYRNDRDGNSARQ